MGVKDCENTMCQSYIGYICYDCKWKLRESNPQGVEDVKNFMYTSAMDSKYLD